MRPLKLIGFSALLATVLGMAALNILIWQGFLVKSDSGTSGAKSSTPAATRPNPPPAHTTTAAGTTKAKTRTIPAVQPPPSANAISTIVLTAARGDCWVVARSDSPQGPILYQALLRQNTSTRLKAKRLWLSLGAAGNLDILVDGKPAAVPAGTVAFLLPSKTPSA